MKKLARLFVTMAVSSMAIPCFAEGSPWLPVPQTLDVAVSFVNQEATKFYRGDTNANLPFGKFTQDTRWFDIVYGAGDKTALDFRFGFSEVDAQAAGSADERMDTTFGVTRSIFDELETGKFSMAVRVAVTMKGSYDVGGSPASPGDGGNALSGSLLYGNFVTDNLAVAADVGVRISSNDVPTEWTMNIGAHLAVAENLGLYAQYHRQQSMGDLDIGGPGFAGRFPEVQENVSRIRVGGNTSLGPLGVDLSWYQVLGGRNTAEYDILSASFSYTFDLYRR